MTTLAAIRPGSINFPLFLHVLGAMALVGLLLAVSSAILIGWRRDQADAVALTRAGLWILLLGVVPAYIVMRVGAQWTESREFGDNAPDSAWLGIGYTTSDGGAVLILVSIVLSIFGLRRTRTGSGTGLGRIVGVISVLLVAAYVVAVWAMTTKPS
jgi:hypothetical protein